MLGCGRWWLIFLRDVIVTHTHIYIYVYLYYTAYIYMIIYVLLYIIIWYYMIWYINSRLWCYVLCRWIKCIVRTHRSRCNDWGTTLDIAQATSRKLRNSQVDRNGDVSSKPRNLLVCCFKHEIHLGYFGMWWWPMITFVSMGANLVW